MTIRRRCGDEKSRIVCQSPQVSDEPRRHANFNFRTVGDGVGLYIPVYEYDFTRIFSIRHIVTCSKHSKLWQSPTAFTSSNSCATDRAP